MVVSCLGLILHFLGMDNSRILASIRIKGINMIESSK